MVDAAPQCLQCGLAPPATFPAFDPMRDESCKRAMIEALMQDEVRATLLTLMITATRAELARRDQDVAQLQARNAFLEAELKLQALHYTNALRDNMALQRKLTPKKQPPARRSTQRALPAPVHGEESGPQ